MELQACWRGTLRPGLHASHWACHCFPHCVPSGVSAKMLLGALDPSVRSQMTSSEGLTMQEHMLVMSIGHLSFTAGGQRDC